MADQSVIEALLQNDVTVDEFYNFITTYGIQDDPWVNEVLQNLILNEAEENRGSPITFDTNDADALLDMIASPDTNDSEFEPWSPGFAEQAMEIDPEFEPWSPQMTEEVMNMDGVRLPP